MDGPGAMPKNRRNDFSSIRITRAERQSRFSANKPREPVAATAVGPVPIGHLQVATQQFADRNRPCLTDAMNYTRYTRRRGMVQSA